MAIKYKYTDNVFASPGIWTLCIDIQGSGEVRQISICFDGAEQAVRESCFRVTPQGKQPTQYPTWREVSRAHGRERPGRSYVNEIFRDEESDLYGYSIAPYKEKVFNFDWASVSFPQ